MQATSVVCSKTAHHDYVASAHALVSIQVGARDFGREWSCALQACHSAYMEERTDDKARCQQRHAKRCPPARSKVLRDGKIWNRAYHRVEQVISANGNFMTRRVTMQLKKDCT